MKLKEILSAFSKDFLRVIIVITNTILALSMIVSPEPHDFFFWFTLGFRLASVPIAIFIGNKGLWFLYFVFTNVKSLDITYNNFTCVALLMMLFALTPKCSIKQAVAMTALYVTDVFIVAGLHNKSAFYIYSHFLLCTQFCAAMWKQKVVQKKVAETQILVLTEEEIKILEQLGEGEPVKNIDGLSEATVYRRLNEACKRNGIENNRKLKEVYKKDGCKSRPL